MNVEILVAPPEELARWFLADLRGEMRAIGSRFTLAVPGGSVGELFFPALAAAALDWHRTEIFWTDERAVPPESAESNHALARSRWLDAAQVPASHVHRMPAELADLDAATTEYARTLEAVTGSPPVLDYVLLGVGADGHVASLFGETVGSGSESVTWTADAPKPPPRRMSLSIGTLVRARRVVVVALDASKRVALEDAMTRTESRTPVARLLREAARPALLATPDAATAALLSSDRAI